MTRIAILDDYQGVALGLAGLGTFEFEHTTPASPHSSVALAQQG